MPNSADYLDVDVIDILEQYRHSWLDVLYNGLGDEQQEHFIYNHALEGVLKFQEAIEELEDFIGG